MAEVTRGFLNAEIGGLTDIIRDLNSAKASLRDGLIKGVQEAGEEIAVIARGYVPVRHGTIRDSIQVRNLQTSGSIISCEVGPDPTLPYVFQREFGGEIHAVNAPFLVFKTYDGVWHRCKSVYQRAIPYMEPAWRLGQTIAAERIHQNVFGAFGE